MRTHYSRREDRPPAHRVRGSVLVETAFVISFFLLCIFMTLGIGIAAFQQLTADGASYIAAHVTAIGSSANGPTTASMVFPHVLPTQIAMSIQPDPRLTTPPIDYSYTSPAAGSTGFAYMVSPAIAESVTQQTYTFFKGLTARTQAVSREPILYAYGTYNVSGTGNGTSEMAQNSGPVTDPGPVPRLDYEATHWYCDSATKPAIGASQPCTNGLSSGAVTSPSPPYGSPLGLPEVLDVNNQSRSVPGLYPAQNSVNWEVLWHQQLLAGLSQYFANHPFTCLVSPCDGSSPAHTFDRSAMQDAYEPHGNFYMQVMAHWDGFASGVETGDWWATSTRGTGSYDFGYGYTTKTAGQMSGNP